MDYYYNSLIPIVLLGTFWLNRTLLTSHFQQSLSSFVRWLVQHISDSALGSLFVGMAMSLCAFSRSQTKLMIFGFINSGVVSARQAMSLLLGATLGGVLILWLYQLYGISMGLIFCTLGLVGLISMSGRRFKALFLSFFHFGFVLIVLYYLLEPGIFAEFFNELYFLPLVVFIALILSGFSKSEQVGIVFTLTALSSGVVSELAIILALFASHLGPMIPQFFKLRQGRRITKRIFLFNFIILVFGFSFFSVLYFTGISHSLYRYVSYYFYEQVSISTQAIFYVAFVETLAYLIPSIVLLLLRPIFENIFDKIIPDLKKKQVQKLEDFGNPSDLPPSLATELVNQEVIKMAAMIHRLIELSQECLVSPNFHKDLFDKVEKYEKITDNVKREITSFSQGVLEQSLHSSQSVSLSKNMRIAGMLEGLADSCRNLCRSKKIICEQDLHFDSAWYGEVSQTLERILQTYESIFTSMTEKIEVDLREYKITFQELVKLTEDLRTDWHERFRGSEKSEGENLVLWRLSYSFRDMIGQLENLIETWIGQKLNY